jgi:hypothetical protein
VSLEERIKQAHKDGWDVNFAITDKGVCVHVTQTVPRPPYIMGRALGFQSGDFCALVDAAINEATFRKGQTR